MMNLNGNRVARGESKYAQSAYAVIEPAASVLGAVCKTLLRQLPLVLFALVVTFAGGDAFAQTEGTSGGSETFDIAEFVDSVQTTQQMTTALSSLSSKLVIVIGGMLAVCVVIGVIMWMKKPVKGRG